MSTFHDFLTWFDGWSENIETQPTAKQWARLREKVAEVRKVEPVPSAVPSVPPLGWPPVSANETPAPTGLMPPTNEREFKSQFVAVLVENVGMDLESANDVWADYKRDHSPIVLTMDPRTAAIAAAGTMN